MAGSKYILLTWDKEELHVKFKGKANKVFVVDEAGKFRRYPITNKTCKVKSITRGMRMIWRLAGEKEMT